MTRIGVETVIRAANCAGEGTAMSLLSPEDVRDLFRLSAAAALLVAGFYLAI